ncbi:hypothetical protein BD408DRAFT_365597 [Parasitella parasitica]|nr:hypothetical protein BD408DRAFT_365597 [Parasitella parasitica]
MSSTYIVLFKRGTPEETIEKEEKKLEAKGLIIKNKLRSAALGFSVEIPENHVNTLEFEGDHFESVEADGDVTTQAILKK